MLAWCRKVRSYIHSVPTKYLIRYLMFFYTYYYTLIYAKSKCSSISEDSTTPPLNISTLEKKTGYLSNILNSVGSASSDEISKQVFVFR